MSDWQTQTLGYKAAMELAEEGFEHWTDKPHNAKWAKRLEATPIRNDLLVNLAEVFATVVVGPLAAAPPPPAVRVTGEMVEAGRKAALVVLDAATGYWPNRRVGPDLAKAVEAALMAALAVSFPIQQGWQPIASAPQRKAVLVGRAGTPMIVQAYVPNPASGWRHAHGSDPICFEPTHWHSLPAPIGSQDADDIGQVEPGADR